MDLPPGYSRATKRLKGELVDDGIPLVHGDALLPLVLDELEYARRGPRFERRIPTYGSIIVPDDRSLVATGELVDLVELDGIDLATARRFADGRATYLARWVDGTMVLACFRRAVLFEADLVDIQAETGAYIVQRTPVLNVTRLFTNESTIEWSGHRWMARATARAEHARLLPHLPGTRSDVLAGILTLAVHWLSPARAGATLILPGGHGDAGLDIENSIPTPALRLTDRHHFPAMQAALVQTDLATVVQPDGCVSRIGVALRSSPRALAEATVDPSHGMRHRSAATYTWDQPDALAVVVSEDGPVTIFRGGKPVSECAGGLTPFDPEAAAGTPEPFATGQA
jgi:DNA integrity scanning protein DisA with diadenylate cyclase activity